MNTIERELVSLHLTEETYDEMHLTIASFMLADQELQLSNYEGISIKGRFSKLKNLINYPVPAYAAAILVAIACSGIFYFNTLQNGGIEKYEGINKHGKSIPLTNENYPSELVFDL